MKLKQMKKIGLVINLNDYIQGKVYIKVKHIMFRLYSVFIYYRGVRNKSHLVVLNGFACFFNNRF